MAYTPNIQVRRSGLTPLGVETLMWYHYHAEAFDRHDAPAVVQAREALLKFGAIEPVQYDRNSRVSVDLNLADLVNWKLFGTTELGKQWVEAICTTPIPVLDPQPTRIPVTSNGMVDNITQKKVSLREETETILSEEGNVALIARVPLNASATVSQAEREANAALIVEAFDVTQESRMSPRQLWNFFRSVKSDCNWEIYHPEVVAAITTLFACRDGKVQEAKDQAGDLAYSEAVYSTIRAKTFHAAAAMVMRHLGDKAPKELVDQLNKTVKYGILR